MELLASLFIGKPLNILVSAVLFLAGYLSIRFKSKNVISEFDVFSAVDALRMNMRVADFFGGTSAIAARTNVRLSMLPQAKTNTVLVAHGNVLVTATDVYPQEAEAIVFRPEGNGNWTFVARISPQDWARLAAEHGDLKSIPD